MEIKLTNAVFLLRKRLLIIMTKTLILLCSVTAFSFTPINVVSQNSKIKIHEDKVLTVDQIFDMIMSQTDYNFIYEVGLFNDFPNVEVKKGVITTNKLLQKSLSFKNMEVIVTKDNTIIIKEIPIKDTAQDLLVTGRVTDGNLPISGASIIIKNTMTGTVSDFDGRYSITAKATDTLEISYLGYSTVTVPVQGRRAIDVTIQEDATTLGEIQINAGYYTTTDREKTGSIARVTAKEIENQPVGNVLSAIQGRMAGVNITQGSGTPGGGFEVQIRGVNSLRRAGNYPLYIIDGVPISAVTQAMFASPALPYGDVNPLNMINPNDIESVEVLKDADATAIYGSRGANGVILITTKKGNLSANGFSFQSSYSLSKIGGNLNMMNTESYLKMRQQAFENDGITDYPFNAYDINGTWDKNRYTNWEKEIIGNTAAGLNVQFSLNGGNNTTNYIINGSHNEQQTVISDNFLYKSNNLSGDFHHKSPDKKLEINTSALFSSQTNNIINGDLTSKALSLSPNAPSLFNENNQINWENNTFENPMAFSESTYNYESISMNSNLNLKYEFLPSFFIKFNGGLNLVTMDEFTIRPSTMYNPSYGITPTSSSLIKGKRKYLTYLVEPQLNYKKEWGNHELDILTGITFQQSNSDYLGIFASGFATNTLITNPAAASNISIAYNNFTQYNYAAIFGRINYQFQNKYIFNITGRRDGSSRFGPNNRFANFGAIGAAWIFSKETFLEENPWFSFGKIRASFGITGNDLVGDYQYLDTYAVNSSQYGGNSGMYPSRLYNPNYSWEKTQKSEIGMELGFLKNRLNFTIAMYDNRSGNQLVGIPLPAITGFNNVLANLDAIVKNTGLELEVRSTPLTKNNFSWETNFNVSFPKNKLLSFPDLEGSTYANKYVIGQPITIVKVYKYEGIDPETGMYSFTDYNGDGEISAPDDMQAVRNIGVQLTGGWSNQFNYKNVSFSFLFQFVKQNQWNYNSIMNMPGTFFNQPVEVLDVWSSSNPTGQYMPYSTGADFEKTQKHYMFMKSTAAISDASFIRLKNVQLSYQVPIKSKAKKMSVYVQGQNLLTFTDYFGLDPELLLSGFTPPLKTYAFGVQFNF